MVLISEYNVSDANQIHWNYMEIDTISYALSTNADQLHQTRSLPHADLSGVWTG